MKFASYLFLMAAVAQCQQTAFVNVGIVDPDAGRILPDMTVVVSGERIAAVGPAARTHAPNAARVVDSKGKFLMPGLWDMHVHIHADLEMGENDRSGRVFFSPFFIANGITGIRSMYDGTANMRRLRAEIAFGNVVGPRIVTSGPMLDGPGAVWPGAIICGTPDEGRAAVNRLKSEGVDFIKVYSALARDVYLAIASEARKVGLPIAGHVPNSISVAEASDAGQKSVEHLLGIFLACSLREKELTRVGAFFGPDLRASAESYDAGKAATLFASFVKNGTWQTPTLTVLRSAALFGDPELTSDVRTSWMPEAIQQFWKMGGGGMTGADDPSARKLQFERELRLTGAMHRAGVKLLAGTDTPNPYVFPGFSLHDELQLLVKTGLTPAEALQAATSRPAEYLGMSDRLGTVAPGKLADLVLLGADPLTDISNTRRIEAVMVNGRLHMKPELDAMLAAARAAARTLGSGGLR